MQPCRSLPSSRACRHCCRVCDRAVGERRATVSVAGIHKHQRWCGRTAHKIHTRAINTKKKTASRHPLLRKKHCVRARPSCSICLLAQDRLKIIYQKKKNMVSIAPARTETVGHRNSVWSICDQHIATSAFLCSS